MRLTESQRESVRADSHVAVQACPGSGKTRALVAKALRCLEETRGTTRHVACLTYTNAAANEVAARVGSMLPPEDVARLYTATIHAFCVRHLLRPYYWASDGYRNGFEIAAPDSTPYRDHALAALRAHGITDRRAVDEFETLGRSADGSPACQYPLTPEVVATFWGRMQAASLMDFPTMLYESWRICSRLPNVVRGISSRYAWLLVDEFQDTTDVQVEILTAMARHGRTRFMIVGDPCQSIFRFAGARPEFFNLFASQLKARTDISFTDNFRSSSRIVDVAEGIIRRAPPMRAAGAHRDATAHPTWIECQATADTIVNRIMPELDREGIARGGTAILASSFPPLYAVGIELRRRGVPIVGPGARPYRRRHLVVPLAECLAACATIGRASSRRWVEREVQDVVRQTSKEPTVADAVELGELAGSLIAAARRLYRTGVRAEGWLTEIAKIVGARLEEAGFLSTPERARVEASGVNVVTEAKRYGDLNEVHVEQLAEFVRPTNHVHLLTVHRSKGREYDAVILIDAHDGRFPFYKAKTDEEVEDGRRLLYVAFTRARRALYILTGDDRYGNPASRFLVDRELPLKFVSI